MKESYNACSFCGKFKTMLYLHACALKPEPRIWVPVKWIIPELSIRGADHKDRGSGNEIVRNVV